MRQHSQKFVGCKPSSKLIWKTKWYHGRDCCDDYRSCEQLKKRVTDKYFQKKLTLWSLSPSITGNTCYHYNTWVAGVFDRNSRGKESQIEWFESNLWSFGYFECSAALWLLLDPSCKGTLLQELAGHLRPRLSSDAQNRVLPKNWSCIQILDTTLVLWILSAILLAIKSSVAPAFYKLIFSNSFKCICSSLFSVINFFNTFATYIFSYFLRQKLTPYV